MGDETAICNFSEFSDTSSEDDYQLETRYKNPAIIDLFSSEILYYVKKNNDLNYAKFIRIPPKNLKINYGAVLDAYINGDTIDIRNMMGVSDSDAEIENRKLEKRYTRQDKTSSGDKKKLKQGETMSGDKKKLKQGETVSGGKKTRKSKITPADGDVKISKEAAWSFISKLNWLDASDGGRVNNQKNMSQNPIMERKAVYWTLKEEADTLYKELSHYYDKKNKYIGEPILKQQRGISLVKD